MLSLSPGDFKFEKTYPIDWYDGIVTALANIQGVQEKFFVSLLFWNQNDNEKIFLILPISDEHYDSLLQLISPERKFGIDKNWEDIQKKISLIRSEGGPEGWIVKCSQLGEHIFSVSEIDIDKMGLRDQVGQSIESAINNPRAQTIIDFVKN